MIHDTLGRTKCRDQRKMLVRAGRQLEVGNVFFAERIPRRDLRVAIVGGAGAGRRSEIDREHREPRRREQRRHAQPEGTCALDRGGPSGGEHVGPERGRDHHRAEERALRVMRGRPVTRIPIGEKDELRRNTSNRHEPTTRELVASSVDPSSSEQRTGGGRNDLGPHRDEQAREEQERARRALGRLPERPA